MKTTISSEQANALREECKKRINIAKSLERLYHNTDFKKVFLENYLKEEAIRLVSLMGDTVINESDSKDRYREDIKEQMIGIARTAEYMRCVFRIADQAQKSLDDLAKAEHITEE